jgi:hypothetical protein
MWKHHALNSICMRHSVNVTEFRQIQAILFNHITDIETSEISTFDILAWGYRYGSSRHAFTLFVEQNPHILELAAARRPIIMPTN